MPVSSDKENSLHDALDLVVIPIVLKVYLGKVVDFFNNHVIPHGQKNHHFSMGN
jgi:hypothetical protein